MSTASGRSWMCGSRGTHMTASAKSGSSPRFRRSPAWIPPPAAPSRRSPSSRSTTTSSPEARGRPASLGAEKPPPGGLAALVVLEFHAVGQARFHIVLAERRLLARYAGEQFRAVHDAVERRGERGRRIAPGHQLAAGVADRVAGGEAP